MIAGAEELRKPPAVASRADWTLIVLLLFATLVDGETDWNAFLGAIPAISFVWLVSIVILFRPKRRI